jgi:hypothetical protein
MTKMPIVAVTALALLTALQGSAQSPAPKQDQQKSTSTPKRATVGGRLLSIDVANKTLRVVPWDSTEKRFKDEAIKSLSWNDATVIRNGSSSVTMAQFLAGKSVDDQDMFGHVIRQLKTVKDLEGQLYDCTVNQTDGKDLVQEMSGVIAFAGMSFAGQVPGR